MARLPGYMRQRHGSRTVDVLLWHPLFWVDVVWKCLDVQPRWAKPLAFVAVFWRFWIATLRGAR